MKVGAGCAAVACGIALLLPGLARADVVTGSSVQVGDWRVAAHTSDANGAFDLCALRLVQRDGSGLLIALRPQGVWSIGAEAADWGLVEGEAYTGTLQIGSDRPYAFNGKAVHSRSMVFSVAPEIFGQLRSGQQLAVVANRKRYTIGLDGVEAAMQRTRECVQRYAGSAAPPARSQELVVAIQTLLARLGYDPGPANGEIGLKTNMAISAFQKSIGEPGDGHPSEMLRARLERVVTERTATTRGEQRSALRGERQVSGTGTGFYISPNTIVTNFHVVNGCVELRLRKNGSDQGAAQVLATSRSDDLAALNTGRSSASFLQLRVGVPIKPAEPVLVFGYPLAEALSSAGNTTLGNVTALAGLRDDSRYIQISAAVQPGNSGGPAVDEAGRVIGVVVAKLDALAVARIIGDIPQNVNFALKVATLVNFLEAYNIRYQPADAAARELPATQRAERAEAGSIQVECRK